MKKTILIADKNGQLGNRLFLFAHYSSNAIENNYRLYFPGFDEFSDYFESASVNRYGNFNIRSRIGRFSFLNNIYCFLIKALVAVLYRTIPVSKWYRIIRLYSSNDLRTEDYDFYDLEKEKDFLQNKKLIILQGWNFRSPQCVIRQKENIRKMFRLIPSWKKKVDDFISTSRKDCDILIGVHIRRGDYRTFANGKYFYDDDVYRKYMIQATELFPGKKIGFIICSNEKISISFIEGCKVTFAPGHFILDLFSLVECDYIIGPPSTFSQWASYFGNKPLKIIWNTADPIRSLNEFKVAVL